MNKINFVNCMLRWLNNISDRILRNFSRRINLNEVSPKNIVVITGCDSGLGFNLALLCHSLNMTVISGCKNPSSVGAKMLQNVPDSKRMILVEIDLLKEDTILRAHSFVSDLISGDNYTFTALVNNAAVMCFGEFEWQTNSHIEKQIQVNVLGHMKITKQFLPIIRLHKGRIINVASHCGLQSLPGLGPYAASKAALRFWNDALRIEMRKYGVEVVNFIPGSFITESNILARQQAYADEMWKEFSAEQKEFYGKYFDEYNNYLKFVSGYKKPIKMKDTQLIRKFERALLEKTPKSVYKREPLRYFIYFRLFKIFPTRIVDWLTEKFVSMPKYRLKQ